MMPATGFDAAMTLIFKHEGGFVDDPHDPGGATNMGISNRAHPVDRDHDGDVDAQDARQLTIAEAKSIYRSQYWDACKCGLLPPALALCVFDAAVNQGAGYARKKLQEALGVKVDGAIGPVTLAAAAKNPWQTIYKFQAMRLRSYAADRNYGLYGMTWFRRTLETMAAAARIA